MVIKEWGQLQRNSVKTYFINYIAQMGRGGGGWNFWLQMRDEQLMQGKWKIGLKLHIFKEGQIDL